MNEISKKLKIAKSTSSLWTSDVLLPTFAQKRLIDRQIQGQYKTVLLKKILRDNQDKKRHEKASRLFSQIKFSKEIFRLNCALIWWCKGNKCTSTLRFTNSAPTLIKNYLFLLPSSFNLKESKFRVLMHLHNYIPRRFRKSSGAKLQIYL